MEENKQTNVKAQNTELTKEQLQAVAQKLSRQNAELRSKLQEINYFNLFKRLEFLFKVLELSDRFAPEFVDACSKEIVELLTPVEEPVDTEAVTE